MRLTLESYEWEPAEKIGPSHRIKAAKKADLASYLGAVKNENSTIEIRGLHVASGKAHSFPIDDLYVPLKMSRASDEERRSKAKEFARAAAAASIELEEALKQNRVVIVGDPGSGKTTFLRRIAYELALTHLPAGPDSPTPTLRIVGNPWPIFIRMGELTEYRAECRKRTEGPTLSSAPAWLWEFLAERSSQRGWNLLIGFRCVREVFS